MSNALSFVEGAGRFRSRDGTALACRRRGAGPPLVLVHGSATDGQRWLPVVPLLERRFTLFMLDRRGHGASDDAGHYEAEAEFDDIAALVEAIGGRPDVVAHSYGALCALGAACRGAGIGRLILYEPPLPVRPGAYFPAGFVTAMRERITRGEEGEAMAAFARDVLGLSPAALAWLRRTAAWAEMTAGAGRVVRELEAVERWTGQAEAFGCAVPTLLLLGGESPPAYRETAECLQAVLPAGRLAVLPGQAHGAINAAPELFAEQVLTLPRGARVNGIGSPLWRAWPRS